MTSRRKYHSITSKNESLEEIVNLNNKKRSIRTENDSDSTLSDIDNSFCELNENLDLYSQLTKWIEKDSNSQILHIDNNGTKEDKKDKNKELLLETIKKPIIEEFNSVMENNEIQKDYFNDYTNEGMFKIPELKLMDKNRTHDYNNMMNLPGFTSFKSDKVFKTERMSEIETVLKFYVNNKEDKLKLNNYNMDIKLRNNWKKELDNLKKLGRHELKELNTFYSCLNGYIDIDYSDSKILILSWALSLCMLHVSKHINNSRNFVMNNNKELQEALKDKENSKIDFLGEDKFRDQGFNRCRVLILCPFKGLGKECIEKLINILPHGKALRGYDRFQEEFGISEDELKYEYSENNKSDIRIEDQIGRNDELYKYLFNGKNNDDEFKIGIQLTKSGINLYSPFDNSDIIVASPLGLRRIIGNHEAGKLVEPSFCSSIEICIVFGADIIYMQNWDHLLDIFKIINELPKKSLGNCDVRRVYQSFLDNKSREFRQTILISSCRREDINSLFRNYTFNRRGFVRLWNPIEKTIGFTEKNLPIYKAPKLVKGIEQMFIKIGSSENPEDCLINYFSSNLYPNILASIDGINQRVLIVLSNYVTYLRIKKYLFQQNATFASCHESSSNASLSRNRLAFYKGELPILITTERFLFFRRYLLKGATKVIFCSPPSYPSIYLDCINSVNYSNNNNNQSNLKNSNPLVITLFHWHNSLALERIVGTSKCSNLIQNSKISKPVIIKTSN